MDMRNMELVPLISSIQSGHNTVFPTIYDEFRNLIVYYSNHLRADDAVQELTVFFLETIYNIKLDKFCMDESCDLQKYIATSIRNRYIYLSKTAKLIANIDVEYSDEFMPDRLSNISSSSNTDTQILLSDALLCLSERQKQMITYKYYYGYSTKEIAEILHISRQSVNQTILRGLDILRNYINND